MANRVIGVIPAHLESTRLPRKPLRTILGHTMLTWVYRRARQARCLDDLLVATDSEEILANCRANSIPVTMTSAAHRSGTDRIFEVMTQQAARPHGAAAVYVNIQGDEPMITPQHIELLVKPFQEDAETQVSTLRVAMSLEEARDPNNVKVVTGAGGRALYFSRALVPYDRDAGQEAGARAPYYKHLGLYAYAAEALTRFHELPPSPLEQREKLEQLRFVENGIAITVLETSIDTIGVDTEEDLRKVEECFRRTGTTMPGD
jgi:3-deoxy-manno-octulosonate cytidylyltransferase (CMP-KDO synthetase)